MVRLFSLLVLCLLAETAMAQCVDGRCYLPVIRPIPQRVFVPQAKPVQMEFKGLEYRSRIGLFGRVWTIAVPVYGPVQEKSEVMQEPN